MNTNQQPDREKEIFEQAVEISSPQERAAFLNIACAGNPALRERLDNLLRAHDEAASKFLGDKPAAVPATIRLTVPDEEKLGTMIGRYKLLEKVGEGGFGSVYVAEQREPVKRRIALKLIKLGMDTKEVVARFEAERQALAMMDHPNIAKVLDAGATESGRPYFVMELVRGIRVTDYCDQCQLPTLDRLKLFIQVCNAVQHAHQKGIIHRDLKPSNILVTLHDGVPVPKVIDFGIAKATQQELTDKTVYTQLQQFIGTPAYISPEQAEMSGLDIDTRADIYSLGVLLYELLTGQTPFDARELLKAGLDELRRTIREVEPMRPSTKLNTLQHADLTSTAKRHGTDAPKLTNLLRGDIDWIVMKCLEKDRARRYDTANGLAADITRHLTNEPVVARPPSTIYRLQKFARRNKLAFSAAAAVALALVTGASLAVLGWRETRVERDKALQAQHNTETARAGEQQQRMEAQTAQKTAEAEQQRADAQAQKANESQEQSRRLLYAADMNLAQQSIKLNNLGKARRLLDRHRPQNGEEDLRGWEWRYLWQLTRSSALFTLTNRPTTRGFDVSFSPDGSRLAVGWWDGRVDLWDIPSRRLVRALTDRAYSRRGKVAFSPVRNFLVATSETNAVALYDLDSGNESVIWRAPYRGTWPVYDLSFSPDGSRVVIHAGDADVWVVNVSSNQIRNRFQTAYPNAAFFGAARLSPDNQRVYVDQDHSDKLNERYSIQCLDVATGQEIWQSEPQRDRGITALAVSPDGQWLASGSGYEDPTIRIWDAATGRLLFRLEGHSSWVSKLVFGKDGRRLFSAAVDQSIRIWNTSDWTETQVLRGHTDELHAVAISETAHLIASTGKDGDLMLWADDVQNASDGYRRLPVNRVGGIVQPLGRSRVLLLPADRPPEVIDLRRNSPAVTLPDFKSSGDVLGWFGPNLLCQWNRTNQILLHEWSGTGFIPRGAVTLASRTRPSGMTYNPSRQLLAWAERPFSNSVFLASLAVPGNRFELTSNVPRLVPFRFSEDGNYLAAGQNSSTPSWNSMCVWNIETREVVASIREVMRNAAFAADGRVLATIKLSTSAHEIRFYDLSHPTQPPRRVPGKNSSSRLAVSPDGGLLAASNEGGEVRLFDPVSGLLIGSLYGHLNAAMGVAFSPDGRRLISQTGGREAVKLWDVGTRQELLTLSGTGSTLYEARWSPDGEMILAGLPWQAWRAPSWEEIAAAEAKDKLELKQP